MFKIKKKYILIIILIFIFFSLFFLFLVGDEVKKSVNEYKYYNLTNNSQELPAKYSVSINQAILSIYLSEAKDSNISEEIIKSKFESCNKNINDCFDLILFESESDRLICLNMVESWNLIIDKFNKENSIFLGFNKIFFNLQDYRDLYNISTLSCLKAIEKSNANLN